MATLSFTNSLTRCVEPFVPLDAKEVRMYSCGPTVYGFAHIGNFRAYVFSDLIHRTLRHFGFPVRLVMNLTDVDDKTIRTSIEKGLSLDAFTAPYISAFFEDLRVLSILPAHVYPRATEHVAEMIRMIETLVAKGHAYAADGSVYFRIGSFENYGRLMNLKKDELLAKASGRMKSDEYEKEQISDFVLWKGWEPSDGDVAWDSPFGKGRPGWHIECSAMSEKHLGDSFDLHTGGMDNKFPHHENEIAQSECAHGATFVKTWMHCSHLMVEGKKMSKSLGNFFTLRDLLAKGHSARAIRHTLIATHYRNFLNFTEAGVTGSAQALKRLDGFTAELAKASAKTEAKELRAVLDAKAKEFDEALADDLNVSGALGCFFEWSNAWRPRLSELDAATAQAGLAFLERADAVFGTLRPLPETASAAPATDPDLDRLLAERKEARAKRDFAASDRIRDEIAMRGYRVKDTPNGPQLEKI